ncbi:MAG: phosphate ABC transporter permease PstA [Chamaesiphon sp.]
MTSLTFLSAALAILPLLAVLFYVIAQGISSLNLTVLTQLPPPPLTQGGGFGNAIVGTLIMVGIGALISIPFGILVAVYLSEFSAGGIAYWIQFATNVLSGVPSIIVGVFAYGVLVVTFKSYSAWAGGFALSILMLPIVVRATEEALKLVPQEIRQASVGLGATNFQTVSRVVLPAALPAIITGTTLAVARAAGETAPLLFTALFTQYWPNWNNKLMEPTASLAVLVYNFATVPFKNQQALAWAASFILVLLVLVTSMIARLATARRVY